MYSMYEVTKRAFEYKRTFLEEFFFQQTNKHVIFKSLKGVYIWGKKRKYIKKTYDNIFTIVLLGVNC